MEYQGLDSPSFPPETIFLSGKIYETVVLGHWHQVTKDSELWKMGSKCSDPCDCPNLLLWEFPSCGAGRENPGRDLADSLHWRRRAKSLERPKQLEFTGGSSRKEKAAQGENPGDLQSILLESLAEYQSVHSCKETTWGLREYHPKGLGATVAGPTGQYKCLRLPARLTKSHDSQNSKEFCLSSSEYRCQNFPDCVLQVCAVHHIRIISHQMFLF